MTGRRRLPRIVVKLGGSLAGDRSLARWLKALVRSGSARFAVVPGGGPFADAVRQSQRTWRFSDEVAHRMAVGAMEQFGRMLNGIEPALVACSTRAQIRATWDHGRVALWLPQRLMRNNNQLAHSWDVTSDTIAAWLARSLRADGLLLVKSCPLPARPDDAAALASAGIVDQALPGFLAHSAFTFRVAERRQSDRLEPIVTALTGRVTNHTARRSPSPD